MKKQLIPIYEDVLRESFEQDLKSAFDSLEKDIELAAQTAEKDVHEDVTSILGLVMSTPFIIKMFGSFIRFIERKVAKYKKSDPSMVGQSIIGFAEKFHHVILVPFEKLASLLSDDKSKQKKLANYMFHGVIGLLLIHGGVTIGEQLRSNVVNPELAFKVGKTGVKAAELATGLRNIIASAMTLAGEHVELGAA